MTHSDPKAEQRLKLRKKTAPDTLRPLLTELETVNVMAGSAASTEEG